MKIKGLPELLAPAGSFEALIAAVAAGADAVYIGAKSFGARAYAKNFETEELERAAAYCRIRSVKLYITVNTLTLDREREKLISLAGELRKIRPDAVIMADLGAISLFRSYAPELEIHASTQMSVHNSLGADEAYRLGCKRVVLARELSFDNISKITERTLAETEIFLHGALCVSHSGQCLMSSLVGGRSGNRGECAQPCRLPYNNGKYPLSLTDLSLKDHIPELISSGVASLKIEGRMKSPDYVYTVTSVYRKLLDEGRNATAQESRVLMQAFSRGGFTDSYFKGEVGKRMTGIRSEEDKNSTRELEKREFLPTKLAVKARAEFRLGEPSRLSLTLGEKSVLALGDIPLPAENAPLTESGVAARLSKMGASFFTLDEKDIRISLDSNINLSPASINALRRRAVRMLEGFPEEPFFDNLAQEGDEGVSLPGRHKKIHTATFLDENALENLEKKSPKTLEFFDIVFAPLFAAEGLEKMTSGVYIPPILTEEDIALAKAALEVAKSRGARYALVGNISHIALAKAAGLLPFGDFRLNVANSLTKEEYKRLGVTEFILSPELSLPMARDIGGGVIVYGRIPLMLTERCFIKENFGCEKCTSASLVDRTGAKFPLMREWRHRNLLLNSTPTYMGDKQRELDSAGIGARHFIFTKESAGEIASLVSRYQSGASLPGARRMGSRGF